MPTDPISGLAAVPYDQAETLGCFKLDFLHLNVYRHFSSRNEITSLLEHDPDWTLLQIPSVVAQLFHVGKHADLLNEVKPNSLLALADCLALIRPQKRFLLRYYLENPAKTRAEHLYKHDEGDSYGFKKAHALAYAMVIVLQLHLIKHGVVL